MLANSVYVVTTIFVISETGTAAVSMVSELLLCELELLNKGSVMLPTNVLTLFCIVSYIFMYDFAIDSKTLRVILMKFAPVNVLNWHLIFSE